MEIHFHAKNLVPLSSHNTVKVLLDIFVQVIVAIFSVDFMAIILRTVIVWL